MRRRTFDWLLSMGGVVLTVVLVVAGVLLFAGYSFADNNVRSQLAAQKIFFPPKGSESITSLPASDRPFIARYAGQQLLTGAQAQAYADHYIAVHLREIGGGQTYAQLSAKALAEPENAELQGQVQTLFRGETLRGLLLTSYAFWKLGQIAKLAMWGAFILAGVMAILTGLGFWHLRRVPPEAEIEAPPLALRRQPA
ncbi:MAG TPA: hypothetical protein VNO79_09180 [Actinomycetota bacterium]|nr:hypothetical protein [Actinomycetota bacterium]